jgi:hypothetical protein
MPTSAANTQDFRQWADSIPWSSVAPEAVAFALNLYEAPGEWHAELVGCSRFDPDDSDWPCSEVFAAREPVFVLTHVRAGSTWKKALKTFGGLLRNYLQSDSLGARRLSAAEAVAFGFVDGDLELIQKATSA